LIISPYGRQCKKTTNNRGYYTTTWGGILLWIKKEKVREIFKGKENESYTDVFEWGRQQ
jgi:hypothetical protein